MTKTPPTTIRATIAHSTVLYALPPWFPMKSLNFLRSASDISYSFATECDKWLKYFVREIQKIQSGQKKIFQVSKCRHDKWSDQEQETDEAEGAQKVEGV